MRRRVLLFAVAVVLVSCAAPGYNASKLQSELRRAGLSQAQAQCVTDGFTNGLNTDQLASHSDPVLQEVNKTHALLVKCGIKTNPPR